MYVQTEIWRIRLYDVFSLKDKRHHRERIMKGMLKASFVGVSEIEHHDNFTVLVIGVAIVAQSQHELDDRYNKLFERVLGEYDVVKEVYI